MRITLAFLASLLSTCAFAQVIFTPGLNPTDQSDKTLLAHIEVKQRPALSDLQISMRRYIDVELAEIESVCDLNKGQMAGLETAAQAAVEQTAAKWNADQSETQTDYRFLCRTVLENPLWRDAVNGLLDADDRAKLEQSRSQRLAFERQARAYDIVAKLDRELSFSVKQRTDVLAAILAVSNPSSQTDVRHLAERDFSTAADFRSPLQLPSAAFSHLNEAQKAKYRELMSNKPYPARTEAIK